MSKPSLLNDLKKRQASKSKGTRCSICELLEALPKRQRDELQSALADEMLYSTTIAETLTERGILKTTPQTVNRHLRGCTDANSRRSETPTGNR